MQMHPVASEHKLRACQLTSASTADRCGGSAGKAQAHEHAQATLLPVELHQGEPQREHQPCDCKRGVKRAYNASHVQNR